MSANSHTELTFYQAKEIKIAGGFAGGSGSDGWYTRQILIRSADGSEFQITVHSVTGQTELPVVVSDEEVL
jgi:hypothetical protein